MKNTCIIDPEFYSYLIAKGYSAKTTQGLVEDSIRFMNWINPQGLETENMSYNDVTAYLHYLDTRGVSKVTKSKYLYGIKQYFNYLVSSKHILYNPVLALKLKNSRHKSLHGQLSPEELSALYICYPAKTAAGRACPPQYLNELAKKRNKVIIGLLVYQGLSTQDISSLELQHVQLREGKLLIPSARRKDERTLLLEPHQIFELSDYIQDIRKDLLNHTHAITEKLFISVSGSTNLANTFTKLLHVLKKQQPKLTSLTQIRANVISHWLKLYDKRKVQHMAGHRYVSSTEPYEQLNMEDLKEEIEKYYPEI